MVGFACPVSRPRIQARCAKVVVADISANGFRLEQVLDLVVGDEVQLEVKRQVHRGRIPVALGSEAGGTFLA